MADTAAETKQKSKYKLTILEALLIASPSWLLETQEKKIIFT